MNEIVYLESDEEITSVIDRLRKAKGDSLALVIPRGGSLAQSIVNLKLLKKSASEHGKEISLVSNDRISRNLASQIGLTVYSKASEAEKAFPAEKKVTPVEETKGDFKVNSYYGKDELPAPEEAISEMDHESPLQRDPVQNAGPNEPRNEEIAPEDLKDKETEEPQDEDINDEPDKIEKEEIKKSYKNPEQNPKSEIRNPKDDSYPVAGHYNNNGSIEDIKSNENDRGSNLKKPMSKNKKIAIGIIAGCLVLLLAVAYIFLPYASAKVMVATEDLNTTETVTINPQVQAIDREKLVIPATTVEIEKEVTKTYKTTGTKDEGTKATGKITISNSYNYDSATFPAGTKFISGDKTFISLADATVPGVTADVGTLKFIAGTSDVLVESENSGTTYNIGPSDFVIGGLTGTKQSRITGHSVSAMTGGMTKTINVVSDTDLKNAEADLTKSIADLGTTELTAKAKDEKLEVIQSKTTSELLSKETSKNINDEADSFDYRMNMKLSVIAYNSADLKTVLTASAEKNLASDKMLIGQDKFVASAELIGDAKVAESGTASGAVELKGTLKGKTGQKISDQEIKKNIKNKKYAEAKAIIEKYNKVNGVDLQIWPSSIARVPMITSRIRVTFDYAE